MFAHTKTVCDVNPHFTCLILNALVHTVKQDAANGNTKHKMQVKSMNMYEHSTYHMP